MFRLNFGRLPIFHVYFMLGFGIIPCGIYLGRIYDVHFIEEASFCSFYIRGKLQTVYALNNLFLCILLVFVPTLTHKYFLLLQTQTTFCNRSSSQCRLNPIVKSSNVKTNKFTSWLAAQWKYYSPVKEGFANQTLGVPS